MEHEELQPERLPDDEAPELAVDAESPDDPAGDLSGRSFDELSDRARAAIEREHAADKAELEPDDAAVAVLEGSEPPGPDADERPV
ncbi:hypothetical protein [Agrococcus sp. HG114]|uniref:hypothetical protein n=1 Tax=Agrococcus sp. HG114 TaxID=2969757 RepID=UPI00215A6B3E|nr:hypothetical protein [Agrococcus sp. HG114]MCR8671537.1 hypothetical protein [Agrococcus sp. HG114]